MLIGSIETGNTFYIDAQSIQRNGNEVVFWRKSNYASRNRFGDLSSKSQWKINCKSQENLKFYEATYRELDNQGAITDSHHYKNQSLTPISSDPIPQKIMAFVCK